MAKQVIRRQGSSSEHAVFTGAEGEWTHDNTLNTGRFHDGNLAGGYPALLSNNINELSTSTNLDGSNFGELIVANSTSSGFTITLPDPSVVGSGWQVAIKKAVDANSVTVSPFDGEGIDGDTSVILENAENALQVRTDGTSWYALRLNNFDDAQEILYDNSTSGLAATTVQGAIDEVVSDSDDFATLDGGNTFNGNQTLNDDLSVNGDVSFQSYSFPSTDGASGEALLTDGAGNLSFGAVGGDIIQEGNSSVEVIDSGVGRIEFTTDGSEAMRIDDSGNVGIGTSSPTAKTYVLGDGGVAPNALGEHEPSTAVIRSPVLENDEYNSILQIVSVRRSLTTGRDSQGYLGFSTLDNSNLLGIRDAGRIAIVNETASSNASPTALGFWTNSGGAATNPASEAMRIDSSGNLQFNSGFGSVQTAYGCRAWVRTQGNGVILDSGNVSSVSKSGQVYTINFSTSMPDSNYAAIATTSLGQNSPFNPTAAINNATSSSVEVYVQRGDAIGGLGAEPKEIHCAIFR